MTVSDGPGEVCGAPHPWMPHRRCMRAPHVVTGGWGVSHADLAGHWLPTLKEREVERAAQATEKAGEDGGET